MTADPEPSVPTSKEAPPVPADRPPAAAMAPGLPPAEPAGTLPRPALEARLAEAAQRRLTVVVAGAGFGKSTLAARVAAGRATAWYTLDPSDRHLGNLAAGVVAALRVRPPDLPEGLSDPVASSIEATDEPAMLAQANAAAALVAAGRHGEARRRYGFYAAKMDEIAVEAAPFPAPTGPGAGRSTGARPGSFAVAPG